MKAIAGDTFTDWIGDAAVVGLWEVLKHVGYFREQFAQTLNEIPNALVSNQPNGVGAIYMAGTVGTTIGTTPLANVAFPDASFERAARYGSSLRSWITSIGARPASAT